MNTFDQPLSIPIVEALCARSSFLRAVDRQMGGQLFLHLCSILLTHTGTNISFVTNACFPSHIFLRKVPAALPGPTKTRLFLLLLLCQRRGRRSIRKGKFFPRCHGSVGEHQHPRHQQRGGRPCDDQRYIPTITRVIHISMDARRLGRVDVGAQCSGARR